VTGERPPLVDALRASGARRVWLCGGGELAAQLLALDAIDIVDVTLAPVGWAPARRCSGRRP